MLQQKSRQGNDPCLPEMFLYSITVQSPRNPLVQAGAAGVYHVFTGFHRLLPGLFHIDLQIAGIDREDRFRAFPGREAVKPFKDDEPAQRIQIIYAASGILITQPG